MEFLINQNNQFPDKYSKEDVQNLIDEKKIGLNTEIWTQQWGEWKQIKDTDFEIRYAIRIKNLTPSDNTIGKAPGIGSVTSVVTEAIPTAPDPEDNTIGEAPGIGWQILAFLMPIAGIIMSFNNSKEFPNKAKRYRQLAGFGIALGLLFRLLNRL